MDDVGNPLNGFLKKERDVRTCNKMIINEKTLAFITLLVYTVKNDE